MNICTIDTYSIYIYVYYMIYMRSWDGLTRALIFIYSMYACLYINVVTFKVQCVMMGIRQQKYFCNKDVSFFSQLRLPGFCSQQISILQVLNYHPIGHILQNLLVNQLLMAFSMGVRIIVSFSFFAERDSAC